MFSVDWTNLAAYQQLRDHDGAAWAWEFLRRNPRYQAEWQDFMTTWNELEALYGSPPDRDFCAWKNDPRAWLRADECAGECRVDDDKVLIECAFGARWGFHKFPPDPADDRAVAAHRLSWREQPELSLQWSPRLDDLNPHTQAALRFDLDLPLRPQLERAKRELQMLQRYRLRSGEMIMRTAGGMADRLIAELRALDGMAAGVASSHLDEVLGAGVRERAIARRDGGYLDLSRLPG